jgi:hypothetical protein
MTRLVQKILTKPKLSEEDVIDVLYSDTKTRDFTISAHTNLILLDALLNTGKFEEYFSTVNQLTGIASVSFARTTLSHVRVFATDKLAQYVDGVYQKASQKIMTAIQAGQSLDLPPLGNPGADSANSVLTESLVSSIRCFKDGFVLVIRASVLLASMPRVDRACYEILGKVFGVIVGLVQKLEESLKGLFGMVEGILGKVPSVVPKNAVLNIKEGVVDVMKGWPRGNGDKDREKAVGEILVEIARVEEWLSAFVIKIGMGGVGGGERRRGGIV